MQEMHLKKLKKFSFQVFSNFNKIAPQIIQKSYDAAKKMATNNNRSLTKDNKAKGSQVD